MQGRTLSGQSASEINGNWGPTLGGMFGITTDTPSVSNHNKAICSAERKKKVNYIFKNGMTDHKKCIFSGESI